MPLRPKEKVKIQKRLRELKDKYSNNLCWHCNSLHGTKKGRMGHHPLCKKCRQFCIVHLDALQYEQLLDCLKTGGKFGDCNVTNP